MQIGFRVKRVLKGGRGKKKKEEKKMGIFLSSTELEISGSRGNKLDAGKFMIFIVRGRY